MRIILVGLLVAMIGACDSSDSGGTPYPLTPQCDEIAEVWCDYLDSCGFWGDEQRPEGMTYWCRWSDFDTCKETMYVTDGCIQAIHDMEAAAPVCELGTATAPAECEPWRVRQ